MKSILKGAAIVAASLAGMVLLLVATVLVASQVMLDRTYPKSPSTIHATRGAEAIARGGHLVSVACAHCHGQDLTGTRFDVPGSTIYAPYLTVLMNRLSDADIDRLIRQGVRPDGKSMLIMPSHIFANFTDDEVGSIIAYLRTLTPRGAASPDLRLGLVARGALVGGLFKTEAGEFAAARTPLDLRRRYEPGRHLVRVTCAGCHGTDLAGAPKDPFLPTPDLMIVAAYDRGDFHTLMRTGKASGGREVGEMSQVARASFSSFTDDEINAIYDYLAARGHALASSQNTASRR